MKIRVFSDKKSDENVKIRRTTVVAAGVLSVLGMGATLGGADASALSMGDNLTVSPVYQQYLADVAAGNGGNWKLVPDKYIYNGVAGGRGATESLPAAYNLVTAGYGTTMKDQGADGDCWAFATTTAIESNLKKTQGVDAEFSPKQIDYLVASGSPYYSYLNSNFGVTRGLGDGGNFIMASYPIGGQYAPVSEASFFAKMQANDAELASYTSWKEYGDWNRAFLSLGVEIDPYTKPLGTDLTMGQKSDYTVGAYRYYFADADRVGDIKSDVYNYGAVYVGTYAPGTDDCYDAATNTVVDRGSVCGAESGHAMSIIGWDDAHAYTDPATGATKTGAFLLQNSWGKSSLFSDLRLDVDAIMRYANTTGMTEAEIAELREEVADLLANYDAPEYVWLGYDFDDSSNGTINFASIREVKANNYQNIYEPAAQAGMGATGDTSEIVYTYTTGDAEEYTDAVAVTAWLPQDFNASYGVFVDASGTGEDYQKVGTVTVPAGESGKYMVAVDDGVGLSGTFKVKLAAAAEDEIYIFGDYAPYFSATVYTVDGETVAVPDTGLFTGESAGAAFGGVVAVLGTLVAGVAGYTAMRNRKHLFRKVKFEKKGF